MKAFTRDHPSPRYMRLLDQYRKMHVEGEVFLGVPPDQTFPGKSLPPQARHVKRLIERTGAHSLLDYGSGKGQQYRYWPYTDDKGNRYPQIQAYWGIEIRCFDPGYAPYSERPTGAFDGVVSTDVLEHVPEEDVPWILDEIFGYATRFVFANVACFPARKRLPTGQNAHCTVKPPKWWRREIERAAAKRPGVLYEFRLAAPGESGGIVDTVVSNAA